MPGRPIEGVATSTAAFVGFATSGPVDRPVDVTGVAVFDQAFGADETSVLRRAVRAFFAGGGHRAFVQRVGGDDYAGALRPLEDVPEIAIVAAPGADAGEELIAHCERTRFRVAILDAPYGLSPQDVLAFRDRFDSSFAALYLPYEDDVPPSGYVASVYARTPPARPPADAGADYEPELVERGVNVVRIHDDGAIRIFGARTLSRDPEWKYMNVRRYISYLERSIEAGTQWASFEPNDEPLWAEVRSAVSDFLLDEFRHGAFPATRPEDAFFVECDRSTMTQDDLDTGRLVCLIGVAPVQPAEFVSFRIGCWTADHRKH